MKCDTWLSIVHHLSSHGNIALVFVKYIRVSTGRVDLAMSICPSVRMNAKISPKNAYNAKT